MVGCPGGARRKHSPYRKAKPMQRITIGRYKSDDNNLDLGVGTIAVPVSAIFDGWVEGIRDDGSSWIMWIDATGNPLVFYGGREDDGGVVGEPVVLSPNHPFFDDSVEPES